MEVIVNYKHIKHNRIKIDPDGRVVLSVRIGTSKKEIKELLEKYDGWIRKHLDRAIDDTLIYDLSENSSVYILGNKYIVRIITDTKEFIEIVDGFLVIHTKVYDDIRISHLFENYLSKLRYNTYKETLDKYLSLTNLSISEFKIRKMKRTLGKCYYDKKVIVLSTTLIHKPIDYIEAICIHEIAHLIYPNHQKDFYNFIYKYMPDYKIRLKHLKNI
ncbi:DUF45 domain-containing protein [bacterium]|nr:DUF45 domain-containing protein [bacterium]